MKAGSRFRNVFGKEAKAGQQYEGMRVYNQAWDADQIAASANFLAVPLQGGGGPICVLGYDQVGKLPEHHVVAGHKGHVLDFKWSPFDDNMLATASDDTTVKLWKIPDGGLTGNMGADDALASFSGHQKKVGVIQWNPTAPVLGTSSIDKTIKIWDIESGSEKCSIGGFKDYPTSMSWSYDGGVLAAVTKSKELTLSDPRESTIMSTTASHPGAKSQRCVWLGSKNLIFTFGFSKQSEREIAIWDPKKLDEPVYKDSLDVSSGVFMPLYDEDLHMLYLGGKGDGNIQYFEIQDGGTPFFLTAFQSSDPQAGLCMKPKRSCNIADSEVACIYKLHKTGVVPIHFTYPRKGDGFDAELFPPSKGTSPALSAEAWFSGSTAPPTLISLNPADGGAALAPSAPVKKSGMAGLVDDLKAEIEDLKKQLAEKDATIAALQAGGAVAAPAPEPAPADDDEPAE